jgi:hypothetical protein
MLILPPKSDCNPPKKLPTIDLDRTVMPRTTPRFFTTLYPGRVKAVVIIESSMEPIVVLS